MYTDSVQSKKNRTYMQDYCAPPQTFYLVDRNVRPPLRQWTSGEVFIYEALHGRKSSSAQRSTVMGTFMNCLVSTFVYSLQPSLHDFPRFCFSLRTVDGGKPRSHIWQHQWSSGKPISDDPRFEVVFPRSIIRSLRIPRHKSSPNYGCLRETNL